MKKHRIFTALLCALCAVLSGCVYGSGVHDIVETTAAVTEENVVKTNKQAVNNSFEEFGESEPFSSYSYEFTAYGSNYIITAALDKTGAGLTLTAEDNTFGFSTFEVTPPENYAVYIPYSQQNASSVCTVIKVSENSDFDTDLLKMDFYLENFENEAMPYTVSIFYSISGGSLVQLKAYDCTEPASLDPAADGAKAAKMLRGAVGDTAFTELDYIPESCLYQTEPLKFMPPPEVYADENGRLTAKVVTYTLDTDNMTLNRNYEDVSPGSLYYGYMAHAIAGDIYRYFIATSLNVTDYENFVKSEEDGQSYNFFKVDDPRFSDVSELKAYVNRYFSEEMTEKMFREAPQKYRDIDGELYTVPGDGGIDDTLGQLVITDISVSDNIYTYSTRQEKLSDGYGVSYINGEFVIEVHDDGTFTVLKYRYPYVS